ncbi:OadG family transporter subunit [Butyrivibrio proteoclasticus]|uniref:OadG family transporter subunit n=1 Tax=Butyrivibrio proteoclasticus TaxID=43305 RepID=UPI00068555D2|nr:OadG family transporter subunit [Butyrivibrio proteoclasticus]
MKHKLLVLGVMVTSLLSLTACADTTKYNTVEGSKYTSEVFTSEWINAYVDAVENTNFETWYLAGVTPDNFQDKLYDVLAVDVEESEDALNKAVTVNDEYYEVNKSGYTSWYKALKDIGFNSESSFAEDISVDDVTYYVNKDGQLVIEGTLQGTKHSALMVIYMDNEKNPTDIGVTVNLSKGEKLGNAGLNTLLGMGMAFTILILISLIISLFPLLFGAKKKKKVNDQELAKTAMDNTISQIEEKEDLSSDAELVAVIAAAIAAYEGSAGTDGFRVRSIRKVNTNWKK